MKFMRQIKLRYLIWMLALPALWWVFRSMPVKDIWSTVISLEMWQVFVLVGLNAIILLLFTSRWWLLLRSLGYRVNIVSLLSYRLAGFGVSYFTPGPQFGGEPLQVHLTSGKHNVPSPAAVAAVSLDKLIELLTNFSFIMVGAVVVLRSKIFASEVSLPTLAVTAALFLLPAAYLLSISTGNKPLTWLAERAPARLTAHRHYQRTAQNLSASEAQLVFVFQQKPLALIPVISTSALTWLLVIAEYWLMIYFLGETLTGVQVISLLTAARIAFLLPSPGGLGTLEASQVLVMGAFGLSPILAISTSLLIRGRDIALGSLGLWIGAVLTQRQAVNLPSQAGD
jgi:uncharacterized protein (TIRG00374 family)